MKVQLMKALPNVRDTYASVRSNIKRKLVTEEMRWAYVTYKAPSTITCTEVGQQALSQHALLSVQKSLRKQDENMNAYSCCVVSAPVTKSAQVISTVSEN